MGYTPQEVLRHNYNNKCDLWSSGVLLYSMLVGYSPFRGDTDEEIEKKVKVGNFAFDGKYSNLFIV